MTGEDYALKRVEKVSRTVKWFYLFLIFYLASCSFCVTGWISTCASFGITSYLRVSILSTTVRKIFSHRWFIKTTDIQKSWMFLLNRTFSKKHLCEIKAIMLQWKQIDRMEQWHESNYYSRWKKTRNHAVSQRKCRVGLNIDDISQTVDEYFTMMAVIADGFHQLRSG